MTGATIASAGDDAVEAASVVLPASYAQERLWLVLELAQPTAAYNVWGAWTLTGGLDAEALRDAVSDVVARHESLRTTFAVVDGHLVQVVRDAPTVWFEIDDLTGAGGAAVNEQVRQVARTIFDLRRGPLLRVSLVHTGPDEHVLALCLHHAVADGWSLGVVVDEISELYAARADRRLPSLPDLAVQYGDFAAWQREWLEGEEMRDQLAWWRAAIDSAPVALDLPRDRVPPTAPTFAGGTIAFELGAARTDAVRRLAAAEATTPFLVSVAAFGAVLARHGAADDVLIGSTAAGRSRPELERLVGFFVNTIVLRIDARGGPTVRELLRRVRDHALGAWSHEDLPFERLVADVQPERTTHRNPLFQVMATMQPGSFPVPALGGVSAARLEVDDGTSPFDLTLELADEGGSLHGALRWSADAFDEPNVARLIDHFMGALDAFTSTPDSSVTDLLMRLPALDADLDVLCDSRSPYTEPLPALLAAQAIRTPDGLAVRASDGELTFAELVARAGDLSARLRAAGAGPGSVVAVSVGATTDLVVALFGVLGAGAAYLAVGERDPADRVAFILADAGVQLAVSTAPDNLPEGIRRVAPTLAEPVAALGSPIATPRAVDLASLAYVVYTSGSTGAPKGVLVTHGGLANYMGWARDALACRPGTVVPVLTPPTVDLTVTALFVPLVCGATAVLVDEPDWATALSAEAQGNEIGLLKLTPSHLAVLAKHPERDRIASRVQAVCVGGELLTGAHVSWWRERAPRTRIVNEYGPTETTVGCTAYELQDDHGTSARVPIGAPLPATCLYVLDGQMRTLAPGMPGELYVGGAGLARGYAGRSDLTADRFVPDPFGGGGQRLYRTGDIVRQLPDGSLDFLARADDQVKLRGFRIEPAEVEAAVRRHPSVRDVAVAVRTVAGDEALVAFVITAAGAALDAGALRSALRAVLPDHMIPSAFVTLDAIERTASGKVDRAALPDVSERAGAGDVSAPPRTREEEVVAAAVAELLALPAVGRDEDFFDLGGHSLLVLQLMARVHAELERELSLRDVFHGRTVAAIAAAVAAAGTAPLVSSPVTRVPRQERMPLSPGEHRLWLLHQLEPARHDYNAPYAFRVRGPLDAGALERAFTELIRRHEALRTRYEQADGVPYRIIDPPRPYPLAVHDAPDRRGAEQRAQALARQPFRLDAEHVLRTELVRVGEHEHLLVIVLHHIGSDGRSFATLAAELRELYDAAVEHREPRLPAVELQPADAAVWELGRPEPAEQLAWWARHLESAPPALDLPADRARPSPTDRGGTFRFDVAPDVAAAIDELARAHGATRFMVGLAVLAVWASRATGQDDIVVGAPVLARPRPELDPVVGFFVNTLALRVDLSDRPTFAALIERVRDTCIEAFAHAAVPFERVVEAVHPGRAGVRNPLFSVMFAMDEAEDTLGFGGAEVEEVPLDLDIAQVDLTFELTRRGERLCGSVSYSTDLFEEATARRVASQIGALLRAGAADPGRRVSTLALGVPDDADSGERQASTNEFEPVMATISRSAVNSPDAPAVVCGADALTYHGLMWRVRSIAARLRAAGARPERLVGVLLPRGTDAVAAILGVLEAGAAYVPLDPGYPRERLAYLVADAGLDLVVTTEELRARVPAGVTTVVVETADTDGGAAVEQARVDRDALAYVIYTSGSTGRPKGVAVTHGNLAWAGNAWAGDFPDEGRPFTIASTVSPSFDVFTGNLVAALRSGGTLLLCPDDVVVDPARLDAYLRRHGADYLDLVPALAAAFVDHVERSGADLSYLRHLVSGADVWRAADFQNARRLCGDGRVVNVYGLTETTIDNTRYRPRGADAPAAAVTPIGSPVTGTTVHLLDPEGQPVPDGIVGELFVGGEGVSRGYLRRPALTAERFVPDAFSPRAGARLYRTGDLGRRRAGGTIEFLGRGDDQVKVRGFRIEPAEVEGVLRRHPGVADVAVAARGNAWQSRLVAWFVGDKAGEPLPADLRTAAAEALPDHMVPTVFVEMDRLPLTPNGKVDRRALPEPPPGRGTLSHGYVAPRSGTEEVVCAAWATVLGVERVGVHDDFFDLGGHSLLAPRATAAVEEALGVEIPLRTIFENPTVAAFASSLEGGDGATRAPIPLVSRDGAIPASYAQQRLWFLDQLTPGTSAYNVPLLFRLRGPLDVPALRRSFAALVGRHETLRTRFEARGGQPVQVIEDHAEIPFVVEDVEATPDPEQALRERLQAHARQPIPLDRAPLLRAFLVRLSAHDHVLLCLMHHIVSDGWSLDIVFDEVAVCYSAYVAGEEPELPALPVQYADYSMFQRAQLQGERLERELAYWREALAGAPAVLELPSDRPRPPAQTFRGTLHTTEVGPAATKALRELAASEGATLYMVLLAGFDAFLARVTGTTDLVVGSPIAARNRPEIEGVIGFFVNTLAVRVDVSGDPTFIDLVRRVRRSALGAYAHQELPFDRLVEELQPARDLAYTPVFQVMFALQNAPFDPPDMPGIVPEDVVVDRSGTPTDLVVEVAETGDTLFVAFTYATDLFDAATMERLARWFVHLIADAAADPSRRVGALRLLPTAEHAELVAARPEAVMVPSEVAVEELVARRARAAPDHPAIVWDGGATTYAELEARASEIAARLRAVGVRPHDRVGVCVPRSAELWAACLAVLKAGAAYVPLDPEYPSNRLAFMLADSGSGAVVTTKAVAEHALGDVDRHALVCLDDLPPGGGDDTAAMSTENVSGGERVAYVMYTSGSTGTPKGIAVPHRAIVRLVRDTDYIELGPDDVVAQASNASFDAATFEVWGALTAGATLRLIDTDTLVSGSGLAKVIDGDGVTTMFLTTSLFNALADDDPTCFGGLQSLLVGGEAADAERFRRVIEGATPPARLVNAYGPTESTTFATWHLARQVPAGDASVPIGVPIANTKVLVLDQWGAPAPTGVVGELHLGGPGLAHGYVGRPGLTAERFVPDPFTPHGRLYRTGDLVRRRRGDGALEFVGRVDEQVKIRGFRIEPVEIEAQLALHPAVTGAAVIARRERSGTQRLVAYVAGGVAPGDVRAFLAERLPEYMVPAVVVPLDRLPLTPNGKIDRRALPEPPASRDEAGAAYVEARNDTERVITAIYAGLLGVERVGIHDDFFELGGHSLLAMQAVARLRETLGIELSLRLIFEEPTAARLAPKLEALRAAGPARARPQLRPLPRRGREP